MRIGFAPGSRAGFCVSFILVTCAVPVHAQVMEIDDDGDMRVFAGPTLFVRGAIAAQAPPPDVGDRYERIARAAGVDPHLLRAVAWSESRGRMNAVSPKGAIGIMQLMPATAVALGVDPRDSEANVAGGARYLAQLVAQFRSVPLALAAYNAGPGAVLRWGGIPPYAETRSYVTSILSRWRSGSVMPMPAAVAPARVDPLLIEVP